jgi:hypothetical protein
VVDFDFSVLDTPPPAVRVWEHFDHHLLTPAYKAPLSRRQAS